MTKPQPMTDVEFRAGIKYIQGAKGEMPKELLVVWLWKHFQQFPDVTGSIWNGACRLVALNKKKVWELVGYDFINAVQEVNLRFHEKRKRAEAAKFPRSAGGGDPRRFREMILDAAKNAATPKQRAFFEQQLSDHDRKHKGGSDGGSSQENDGHGE